MNTQESTKSRSLSAGQVGLYAVIGIVVLVIANWLVSVVSDWFSWPLILIGAVVLVVGMATDSKSIKLIGVGMVLVGTGLLMVGWTTGLLLRLIKIIAVIGVFFVAATVIAGVVRKK